MTDLLISTLTQGLIYALISFGVYITYSILDFPDLGVDGTFPLGAAVTAVLLTRGVDPWLTLVAAVAVGALAGLFTGVVHVCLRVRNLLAGIITMTALFSINLQIAGSNLTVDRGTDTIFTSAPVMAVLGDMTLMGRKLVVSLVLAVVLSQKISKPIIKTNNAAKELAQGNYEVSFEGGDYREIRELNSTLSYAASELSKVEALRKELIANISHDLRTPLTMIGGYSEMMRDIPGENTPENAQIILDETTRLTNLVNDMLNLSRLQSGTQTLTLTEFSLTQEIREILARYNSLTKRDGYHIVFDYKEDVTVEADQVRMSQVIYNLVNNAVNYAGQDKEILVRQRLKPGFVRVEVIDHGEGIEPEKLELIWDRYYKVDKTHRRAVVGTGLGLSIVKSVLEMHSAKYGVESAVGEGSTFWFELPLPEYLAQIDESQQQ